MKLVKVVCPQCGGSVEVDKDFKTARCPFCSTSFVIESEKENISNHSNAVYATTVIECSPKNVKEELEIYSLFGWDYKDKKVHHILDKNNRKKEVVQITLQRNVKASWFSNELLQKEKQFLKLRKELIGERFKHDQVDNVILDMYKDQSTNDAYLGGVVLMGSLTILSLIFLVIALFAKKWVFGLFAFIFLSSGLGFGYLLLKRGQKKERTEKTKYAFLMQKKETEYMEKQKVRAKQMNDIILWAVDQMEKKFGYKITPSTILSKIDIYREKEQFK